MQPDARLEITHYTYRVSWSPEDHEFVATCVTLLAGVVADRPYSGKFNLRAGESVHRELAIQAAEDGMSLNQYVLRKLRAA
jgi:predicted HicB family RNase H-like nuclease